MSDETLKVTSAAKTEELRRPFPWLLVTVLTNILSYLAYGLFICGCHFHKEAVPFGLVPVGWGFFMFATHYRSQGKLLRLLGIGSCLFWLFLSWVSNLQFYFQ